MREACAPAFQKERCAAYADIEPQSFTAIVPAALSGALTVRMVAKINGSLRTFTYGALLTQAP